MRSLRFRLSVVWVLSLIAAVAVAVLMAQIHARSISLAEGRAQDRVVDACEQIRNAYQYYDAGSSPSLPQASLPQEPEQTLKRDLAAVLVIALSSEGATRGGIWEPQAGLIAKFPGDAADFPRADIWRHAVEEASERERNTLASRAIGADQMIVAACPLPGSVANLAAFASIRVASQTGLREMQLGFAVLLLLVLAIAGWLTWLVASWTRHVRRIEQALAAHADAAFPQLELTGERELDQIVGALNQASARVHMARLEATRADARVAAAEKLAALGRVAAGVAHEIRNPIAAMRLRAENALAGDDARRRAALDGILGQIARLDRLLSEMLAMTQSRVPAPEWVDLDGFLADCAREHAEAAAKAGVTIATEGSGAASFDPAMIRRAVSNVLQNAIRETPRGGRVSLRATIDDAGAVQISVADTGSGVSGALVDRLFEPFVTGRADGTGLGLAIARELVSAHGGSLELGPSAGGATFLIALPPHAETRLTPVPASV